MVSLKLLAISVMVDVEDHIHPEYFAVPDSIISAVAFKQDAPPTASVLRFDGQSDSLFPESQKSAAPPGNSRVGGAISKADDGPATVATKPDKMKTARSRPFRGVEDIAPVVYHRLGDQKNDKSLNAKAEFSSPKGKPSFLKRSSCLMISRRIVLTDVTIANS